LQNTQMHYQSCHSNGMLELLLDIHCLKFRPIQIEEGNND